MFSLNDKLVAYDFVNSSGLNETAVKTGHTSQKLFNSPDSLTSSISTIVFSALSIIGVIFLVLIIYAGITWMTAEGNEDRVEKAKKTLTQSIIGIVIVFAAYAISYFVISQFVGQTLN